jgi:hypothetical protein
MKKISTVAAQPSRNLSQAQLTIGLDLGDRSSWYCVLDEAGAIVLEQNWQQPDGAGNRDALALGKPGTERVGA